MNAKITPQKFYYLILPISVLALSACSASIQVPPQAAINKGQPAYVHTVRQRAAAVRYPPQAAIYKGRPVVETISSETASIPAPAWVAIIKSRQ